MRTWFPTIHLWSSALTTDPLDSDRFSFDPDWASPPGHTLETMMDERGWNVMFVASKLNLLECEVQSLLNGSFPIDDDLAELIGFVLGPSKLFWIRRERTYREALVKIRSRKSKNTIFRRLWRRWRQSDRIDRLEAENRKLSAWLEHGLSMDCHKKSTIN